MRGAILLAFVLFANRALAEPVKLEPRGGRCTIEFPMQPTERTEDRGIQLIQEAMDGRAGLMLQYNEVPPGRLKAGEAEDLKKLLADAETELVTALQKARTGTKLLRGETGMFTKYYSRDVEVEVPELGIYRVRFVVTPNLFYQLTVCGPKEYVAGPEAQKFMESFKIRD